MEAKNSRVIGQVKQELTVVFEIVNMGSISFYLYFKICQDRKKKIIKLFQPTYISKILTKFYLAQAHILNMLMRESSLTPN